MGGDERRHVVMFPFMAQGHLIPFLALALEIEGRRSNWIITMVNTARNIDDMRRSMPSTSAIRLRTLPFSAEGHGLPPEVENTDSLKYPAIFRFVEASASLKPAFRDLVAEIAASDHHFSISIVADFFFAWSVDVAREFRATHVLYMGTAGFGGACYHSLWTNNPLPGSDETGFTLPDFTEAGKIQSSQLSAALRWPEKVGSPVEYIRSTLLRWGEADGLIFNTVEGLDSAGLNYFRRKFGKPVWAVGPVQGSPAVRGPGSSSDSEICKQWLDSKSPRSVLYVSFGSQNTPSAAQMKALAQALEASRRNFIWVVRPPLEYDINSEFREKEFLPPGFEERATKENRGLLVRKWAPQVQILSHPSTAAFLSHCGWNSSLEALTHGIPILGWPMAAEQFYNSIFLQRKVGVCIEVARGYNTQVRVQDLADKIHIAMGSSEHGNRIRAKAVEVMAMIKAAFFQDEKGHKGSSIKAMDEFLCTC